MQNSEKGNIHDLLKERWSPRAFSDKEIDKGTLRRIFEAARWAPSSFNEQPWRFIIGQKGDETYDKIIDCMAEFNQKWAKTAPVVMLTVAKDNFSKNDKENKHSFHDVGQAVAYISVQAMHENIYLHQMAGYSAEKAIKNFDLSKGYSPVTTVAMGYMGVKSQLPEDIADKESPESKRKVLDELVFTDGLKTPLSF